MRVFITGGTGFIGGHVVRTLRERGDEVRALVRSPDKARGPRRARLRRSSTATSPTRTRSRAGMHGCDAAIHGAAIYEVGIPKSEREAMYEANVIGTENVLRAALEAKVPKVVYISTVGAFGNTSGQVVDESYEHPGTSFTSYYEETKLEAHRLAKRLIAEEGLPCVIVQPGGVYGPRDHSALGKQINQFLAGRMPLIAFPDLGFNMVHVEDVAAGVLLALDKGKPGEAYVLGGQITTMRELIQTLAEVAGKKAPRRAAADPVAEGDDPLRPDRRQGDGPGPEPARADQLRRQRHLLGQARQGDGASSATRRAASSRACATRSRPRASCPPRPSHLRARARAGRLPSGAVPASAPRPRSPRRTRGSAPPRRRASPTGSPKTRMPPTIEAQFAATAVSAITGIASPPASRGPTRRRRRCPPPAPPRSRG